MHEKNIIKVGVLVCNNKESARYPGKNEALRIHSFHWLFEECAMYCRDMEVFGVELLNPWPVELDYSWQHDGHSFSAFNEHLQKIYRNGHRRI